MGNLTPIPNFMHPTKAATRFEEIDAIKGLAIIGVIIAHMSFTSRFDPETIAIIKALQLLFAWSVIAFFYTSGALARDAAITNLPQLRHFASRRFKRLILPSIVFSCTYNLILMAMKLSGRFSLPWQPPDSALGPCSSS
ncbi:acyltransferase family protein [Synechococcus sp. ATX 2A4]|uniref:acyltransferase family protein n=1 Tax=Synechococcus sp. ATX 2A4 TaxID=2823727 RepID=UPI0020CC8FF5|nr:acyltransferase family protein [Synechococcus sp. ATX 2A4]MCP9884180.1 acyltransferase family protein [Synechococcus sp. ATX 2A4]